MAQDKKNYLLKVFSGPHIGAEIMLPPGDYTIGSSPDCDIVLQDESVALKHARIVVGSDLAQIVNIGDSAVFLNGRPITSDMPLVEYEAISLGTTHLALGKHNGAWNKVRVPIRSLPTVITKEENVNDNEVRKGFLKNIPKPFRDGLKKATAFETDGFLRAYRLLLIKTPSLKGRSERTSNDNMPSNVKSGFTKKNKIIVATLTALSALTLLPVVMILTTTGYNDKPINSIENQASGVRETITQNKFADIDVSIADKKSIHINGYVDSAKEKEELYGILALQPSSTENTELFVNIFVGEKIEGLAKTVVSTLGLKNIDIKYASQGNLIASGYVADKNTWRKAKHILLEDIAGLKGISDEDVTDIKHFKESLSNRLEEENLAQKIRIEEKNKMLYVDGVVNQEELKIWKNVREHFESSNRYFPAVHTQFHSIKDATGIIFKRIHSGVVPYVVSENGSKYLEGAPLPNGFVISKILRDKVILKKDFAELVYQIY